MKLQRKAERKLQHLKIGDNRDKQRESMRGKISPPEISVDFDDIKIGNQSLADILQTIHDKVQQVVQDISIESQSENPDYSDIDAPLHGVLDLIENINR